MAVAKTTAVHLGANELELKEGDAVKNAAGEGATIATIHNGIAYLDTPMSLDADKGLNLERWA